MRGGLRRYDWAGLELCVEVPPGIDPERDWVLPGGFVPSRRDDDGSEDVRICFDARDAAAAGVSGTTWFHEGDVFEAGRIGPDHWLRLAEDGRIALADASFRWVHVMLPASFEGFPLAHPLDDLILIHRALQQGAFALRATAVLRDGDALVVLGEAGEPGDPGRAACWHGWLLLRPGPAGVEVAPLPSTRCGGRIGEARRKVRLAGLHVLGSMTSDSEVVRVLDPDAAAAELLRYAFAPIGAADVDRAIARATAIAREVPVVQLRTAARERFSWHSRVANLRSVLPAGA